jgi:hypothetical protein
LQFRILGIAVASAGALLWATSGTQRERPLLTGDAPEVIRAREASAAAHPDDPEAIRALGQAYLDAQQPGLALSLFNAAAPAVMADPRTEHLHARALLDQGRNVEALAIETKVVGACTPFAEGFPRGPGCDAVLLASALRRSDILKELVTLGVEDTRANPEASLVAYQNATREARVMTQ